MINTSEDETYLGDGLYASFDGHYIRLRAPRMNGEHEVFLEPDVLNSFMQFIDDIMDRAGPHGNA